MYSAAFPLADTLYELHDDHIELDTYLNMVCDRIEHSEPHVEALLPEKDRRVRLLHEAELLQKRFPDRTQRPPLYGILVGIKDLFTVDGFTTHAGSQLPTNLFTGPEATCVSILRDAGALVLGLTVATEFAYFEPGPTRNPHNPAHSPGGSSSGSAAAVAAGYCQLALGTQTSGSVLRPASYCGLVGFKPGYGRISTAGMIFCSPTLDTVGYMTQDLAGTRLVAPLLCENWRAVPRPAAKPVLGIPSDAYLSQASEETLRIFQHHLEQLAHAGYTLRRSTILQDIEAITHRHQRLVCAEMAQIHREWFGQYTDLYRPRTAQAIREGQTISYPEYDLYRTSPHALRNELERTMTDEQIDLWISPAAPGTAPEGIETTGSPALNLPWTHAGLPALTLPAGRANNGLPLGLQYVARSGYDEHLLAWADDLASVTAF